MVSAVGGSYADLRAQLLGRTGVPGPARRRALARLTDGWLAELAGAAGVNVGGVALVAVGGYGRGELSPYSDLDLVLLHSTETPVSYAEMLAERLWYPIWDSRVKLDHSVRSVGGARQIAKTDLPAMLGMLDLRHIAGDPDLAATLRRRVLADWRNDAKDRLPELEATCRERFDRSGEIAFSTAPNLKESRGGLRDLVVMRAVAASWLADCPHQGLEEARSELLDVRDALHLTAGRGTDRLQIQEQDAVAESLGYPDRDALLTHVAGIGRTVSLAADLTWHRVNRVISGGSRGQLTELGGQFVRRPDRTPLANGVVEQDGEAVLARVANPANDATLTIRTAAAAAQAGLPINPGTVLRLAKVSRPLPEPWPAVARDAFVSLLGAGEPMITVWESLDQAGLIAALLPGWERLRSMPQWDPIHVYTVDRHLMETAVQASALVRQVSRPDLLLIAAIFHDIGKGLEGDHSTTGAEMVTSWAERIGLGPKDSETIRLLVLHHLLLADTATRRDPDDPATVASIIEAIGDVDTLDLLQALTEADGRAAGPTSWSSWKAAQVRHLAGRVRAALGGVAPVAEAGLNSWEGELVAGGGLGISIEEVPGSIQVRVAAPDRPGLLAAAAGVLTMHRMTIRGATARTVGDTALQVWSVQPQFGGAPEATVLRVDLMKALDGSLDVAGRMVKRSSSPSARAGLPDPLVRVLPDASDQATVIEVRAHDAPGMLYRLTTALAGSGAVVRSARVDTLGSEAVDVFYVVDRRGLPFTPGVASELAEQLRRVVSA
ncbi:[protein-PII] uridylyltransferase [Nakamurella silvestris]|nr:[protein-PII] uridylyltransferase [Nakamurella silvestris]